MTDLGAATERAAVDYSVYVIIRGAVGKARAFPLKPRRRRSISQIFAKLRVLLAGAPQKGQMAMFPNQQPHRRDACGGADPESEIAHNC
jgi:hypothetical protein